ncbi:hypothetical protein BLNAU_10001 [Blattamonas nauphoetae]|uniref:RRM domain-containing protein n=1 Tax=Blattamonas nauphoetae TaxID=2049346 RepID=A0ABQ9XUC5_9EUKA|nr:hypothetical protein BLNAU_10001 [Blattamonas nauphoetae]
MSLRTITEDYQSEYGTQCLNVLRGDIVEVLGEDTNGWTYAQKHGTQLTGYVLTRALGPSPAPSIPEQEERLMSLQLLNVQPSPTVEDDVKSFFSQFGEVFYFDSQTPSHHHPTFRFFIDILSIADLDTIQSYLVNQPFNGHNTQFNLKHNQPNRLELYLAPFSPSCTEADIRTLIHPANPTKVSLFFPKNNRNIKCCAIVFPDARSANAAFRDRSHWIAKQPGLTVQFSTRSDHTPANHSQNHVSTTSKSVFLTNLPNGVIPRDIVVSLFPTSVITNLKVHSSQPGQPVSAVVHFKTVREAQHAISQSGTLSFLSNRIQVREYRADPDRSSRGSVSPKSVSPPPHQY